MEEEERKNNQAPEAEPEEASGVMLLGFVVGLGLAFLGLFFVLTGIGALIGVGMIILGGLLSAFSGLFGELREWLSWRRKKS
jgi:apolipoprotein N-acyltransferase